MLRHRLLTSVIALPILILLVWLGSPWFTVLASICALIAFYEFSSMAARSIPVSIRVFGGLLTLFLVLNAHFVNQYGSDAHMWAVSSALAAVTVVAFTAGGAIDGGRDAEGVVNPWVWYAAGVVYVGLLTGYWVLLMNTQGSNWVFLALLGTFAVDTTAYFVGRSFGRHKLAPVVSPAKTWEGSVGGLAGAVAVVLLLSTAFSLDIAVWSAAVLGVLLGLGAQLGDLFESKLKRTANVKEAGSIIPGHGGLLDRLDSILVTGVVVYYWATYVA